MRSEGKTSISRRGFLRASTLAAAGIALAACAPKVADEPAEEPVDEPVAAEVPPEEKGLVQYWVAWGGDYSGETWDALKETDEFKEALGNNDFEIKGSAREDLITAVAAGDPPDGASNIEYLDYMARGSVIPIEDWVANSSIIKEEDYLEGTWSDAFYKGVMYGVPANEGFLRYALNYNARMVADAGLDPDSPPTTWEDLFEWHKELTKFDSSGNLLQIGLDPYDAMSGGIWISDGFYAALSWGWDWFSDDTDEFDLDNDKMIEAFEVMGEFVKFIGPDNLAGMRQVEGHGTWGGSYHAEVQAALIDGYWRPGWTMIAKPEVGEQNRSSWAPVPASRGDVKPQGIGGHYVIFYKDGDNTEGMFRIAEFLNTNVACDILFELSGFLPGWIPYLETTDQEKYPGLDFFFKSMDEATYWHTPARCPITRFVANQYQELYEAQYREQMTSAEAAAEFQKRCEEELARMDL